MNLLCHTFSLNINRKRKAIQYPIAILRLPEGLGWDKTDVRINLGRYDRILLLDPKIVAVSEETRLEFFDLVQVPIETMKIDLSFFENVVTRIIKKGL